MSFLAPWATWFLAGVPVIVLLYLLKLKRRPITVSTLLFWERVMQENRQRALFQKLRHLLSLLLHLLIFLLIVAALSKPALDRRVRAGSSVVLLVDTRARMQAVEEGGTRFERALAEVRRYIHEAGAGRQLALLTAGATPNVVVPFTSDERALLNGLDSLVVTDATGDLETALALSDSLLASRKGDTRIVVFTDRAQENQKPEPSGARQPAAGSPHGRGGSREQTRNQKREFRSVGKPHDNVAITRFATRPLLNSPQTSEVLLAIKNFSAAPVSGNVEIAFDGKLLDVKPFTLEAGKERLEVFASVPRASRNARGWLTARLDTPDALRFDNVAYAVLPAPAPHRVLLVTKGNWFLEKLLAADQQVQFELIEPGAWQADFAAKFDAIILDNFQPPGFDLAQAKGNFLFLKQSPFTTTDPPIEQPLISDTEATHPALRLVSLQNVSILRAVSTKVPEPVEGWTWQAPLRSFDHPLLITGERRNETGGQRVAALSFDVADSDLPLRVAFPLLMANTIHWLAGETAQAAASVAAGTTVPLEPEVSLATTPLTDPAVKPGDVQFASGFFQPLHNGFYLQKRTNNAGWLAVNTFSEAESDLRGAGGGEAAPTSLPSVSLATISGWPLWQYLALAALALFTLEWWLFHRRRTE
jgi:hypothetical protein